MKVHTLLFLFLISIVNTAKAQSFELSVNQNIELYRIAWLLAYEKKIPKDLVPKPSNYNTEVHQYFKQYKKHPSIKLLKKSWLMDYSFPKIGIALDSNYELTDKARIKNWIARFGEEKIQTLIKALQQFAIDSDYNTFYSNHKAQYELMTASFENEINQSNWLKNVCAFYDCKSLNKIIIYFEPLNNCGNYELSNKNSENVEIAIAYLSDEGENLKVKSTEAANLKFEDWIERVFYHELSHYFTSPITCSESKLFRSNYTSFYKDRYPLNPSDECDNQIDETFVRAFVAYIFELSYGEEKALSELKNQTSAYPQINLVYKEIKEKFGLQTKYSNENFRSVLKTISNTIP